LQIISWFIILLDFYTFFFINIVSLSYNIPLAAVLGTVYGIIFVAIIYLAVVATKADPTDPTVYLERECKKNG
jgi:hypothetical protein